MKLLRNILLRLQTVGCYLIADPLDNTITLSDALYRHIQSGAKGEDEARAFVFFIPQSGSYGFSINPEIEEETQWCPIQFNEKNCSIGFQSLCPSVNKILYDYGMSATSQAKLSVTGKMTGNGKIFYQINRPNAKRFR